jgi:hypothetical protein
LTTFYIAALGNSSQMKSEVSTDDIVPQLILTFLAWT